MKQIIKNGRYYDVNKNQFIEADLAIEDGKFVAIGKNLQGDQIIDATSYNIYPGMVECHGHTGLDGYAIGFEGQDYNESNDPITPHLRAIDGINPFDEGLSKAAKAGITTIATGPGSSNVVGGTFCAIKTFGSRVDRMVVKENVAMKCAFGENPKKCFKDKGNRTRMTTAANLRNLLFQTIEYSNKKDAANGDVSKYPSFNMKLEAMIPVIKKEMPLKAHVHQANDIFTAIRIAKEFDLKMTLEHVTEGHLVVDELKNEPYPMVIGPSFGQPTKYELQHKTFETPGILANAGCQISITTDSPVVPQWYLPLCAKLAVNSGMKYEDAIKAITINPAKHLGLEDQIGSIEVGKDADFIICTSDLLDVDNHIEAVYIRGEIVHD